MGARIAYRVAMARVIVLSVVVASGCLAGSRAASGPPDLTVGLSGHKHPYLACTPEELQRARQAYRRQGADHDVVAASVKDAERFVDEPVVFPPRGGQHNQWYQCDKCEIALKTIDPTHHQCPKCKKVYSGHPYDDVIFSRQHSRNLQQMRTAAWAHTISGREPFAEYAAKVLLGYAERYTTYPYHSASLETESTWGRRAGGHLFEQTLTEAAGFATSIGPAYDLIHDSGVLSANDHERIREGLLLPMLRNIDRNKAGKSNWQTWHNAAMLWGGALVNDPAWIRKAITDPANGFYHQMDVSVSKEGMWYENSWGYHFYTLRALVIMAETARRLDVDLWGHERLKKMFTLPAYYTMADGMLPRFGDDVNSSVRRVGSLFEPAYRAYQDRQIMVVLSDRPSFESVLLGRSVGTRASLPVLESVVFEDAGHAILRGAGPAGLTAAMTFGPYGGFHGHYDKLSFVFFGFAKELGVDPGRARSQAYRLPIHTDWYKATIAHNAVLVDGQSQKPAAGTLELFERQEDYVAVAASCDRAYPGVKHRRLLVMTQPYLLVFDELRSDTDHRFDWLYHNRASRVLCDAVTDGVTPADGLSGGEYIRNARRGTADEVIRIAFEDSEITTHLTVAGRKGTTVTLADGVGASVTDRVPMAMIARTGRDVAFVAVLAPVRTGDKPPVTDLQLIEDGDAWEIAVRLGHRADRLTVLPDNRLAVSIAQ